MKSSDRALHPYAPKESARHLRAELLAEHAELELLIEELQRAVDAGDCKALVEPWRNFESALAQHFANEETELLPAYAHRAPAEARAFEQAHTMIRKLVEDLGLRIELHSVRAEEIGALLDALRAHRLAEEVAFYRWADERAGASAQAASTAGARP
jgi:hypothetical protein